MTNQILWRYHHLRSSIFKSGTTNRVAEAPLAPGGHVTVGGAGHDAGLLLVRLFTAVPGRKMEENVLKAFCPIFFVEGFQVHFFSKYPQRNKTEIVQVILAMKLKLLVFIKTLATFS